MRYLICEFGVSLDEVFLKKQNLLLVRPQVFISISNAYVLSLLTASISIGNS